MAITAGVQPELGWIVNMPDLASCHIQFSSKEGLHHIVQNQPRSCVDSPVRFWLDAFGLEASQCGSQPAHYQFPTRLRSSTDSLDHIVQNRPRSDLVLADCVQFGPNRSDSDINQIRHVYWEAG